MMETLKILSFIIGIPIIIVLCWFAHQWIRETILLKITFPRLYREEEKKWIPFDKIVNPDNSFNPCPNCGGKLRCKVDGSAFTPIISNPQCADCNCYLELVERSPIDKRFRVVVS